MNKHEAFTAWAPPDSVWSPWAKPVVFAHMADVSVDAANVAPDAERAFDAPALSERTALILDLPGAAAAELALDLAAAGYRPVPLYNAAPAPDGIDEVVAVRPILAALRAAAARLAEIQLPPDAPPAFLLDADRRTGHGPLTPGRFDNRSISLPTDFPSAGFLAGRGIGRVVLIQDDRRAPQEDVAHTLLRYQQAGLSVLAQSLSSAHAPEPITVAAPRWYRPTFHRFLAAIGLRRNPLGGFGGTLPEPSAG